MENGIFFKRADPSRIALYDTLRGFMMILVIIFHTAFDLYWVFGKDFGFLHIVDAPFVLFLRDFFAVCFIILSGICTNYSRNPLRRGIIVFLFGLIVTLFSALVTPDMTVRYGILSLIGASMIVVALMRPFHAQVHPLFGAAVGMAAFFATVFVFPVEVEIKHLYFLGFITRDFASGDFYPMIPYYFAFLAGHFFGRWLKEKEYDLKYGGLDIKPLSFIGRNSVYFYLLHQPVVYGVCWLLFTKMGL
ncbi:MAG: DUF1624 domain-containing protein [Clostridia bacterium]|nr:DUF1624 domain-containing protein [Clostridia bacterium]